MDFEKLDLKHQAVFNQYRHLGNPISSVQNFAAQYMWKDSIGLEICETENIVYLRRTEPPILGFLSPFTKKDEDIVTAVSEMKRMAHAQGHPCQIIDAEQWMIDQLKRHQIPFSVEEDRDNSEYLYTGKSLRTLSGKKMHGKRNHYNRFVKNQIYEIRPLKENMKGALDLAKRWLEGKESKYTLDEIVGLELLFKHWDLLPIKGLAIFIDGVCQAFTITEDMPNNNVLVHVEKANDDIPGLYSFINSESQRILHPNAEIVNREQDMGVEGLRKAKLSWRPIGMVDKFTIKLDI